MPGTGGQVTAPKAKHRVPDVVKMVREYYRKPGNAAGGNLHLVLEEPNYDDDSVRYCMFACVDRGDVEGSILALTLLECSKSQRRRIAREAT
jgi:hypothetical protein